MSERRDEKVEVIEQPACGCPSCTGVISNRWGCSRRTDTLQAVIAQQNFEAR
jgi:hypothetical protein